MKKLFFTLLMTYCSASYAQLFPIRSFDCSNRATNSFKPLTCEDTLFIEDLIGEGKSNPPKVLDCFVTKFSEWNMLICYKLVDCEMVYVIKDGYIGPIYIYKGKEVTVLKDE